MTLDRVGSARRPWRLGAALLSLAAWILIGVPGCGDPARGTISLKGVDSDNLNAPAAGAPAGPSEGGEGGVRGRGMLQDAPVKKGRSPR